MLPNSRLAPWSETVLPCVLQATGLQPPPVSPDSLHKKEVSALKQQLDKLLGDLETKSHELRTTSTAHADMKHLLQQASESHCAAEGELRSQIAKLRSDLELKTRQLRVESRALAEAEAAVQSSANMQGQGLAGGQLAAALRRDVDSSDSNLQAAKAELGANQQVLTGKQQEVELLRLELAAKARELEGNQQELQAGAHSHAELDEVVPHASEEQSMAQLTALQHEVKVMNLKRVLRLVLLRIQPMILFSIVFHELTCLLQDLMTDRQ